MDFVKSLYTKYITNHYLSAIDYNDTTPFTPPLSLCKVIKVYDGDTITVAQKFPYKNSPIYRFSVRLKGIDCPEIKGQNADEKECAQLAKQFVSDKVLNNIVELKHIATEKYGRVLADVYYKNDNLRDLLIEEHLAVAYDGGTKRAPTSWMGFYNDRNN